MRTIAITALLATCVLLGTAGGEIQTATVEYRDGDAVLEGFLAWDDQAKTPSPGVLVVHEWWGLNDFVREKTRQLAQMGFVAFAADIYGQGNRAATSAEAAQLAGPFRTDRALLRRRAQAGLDRLRSEQRVDASKLAAIGFCFGGTTVLELARGGADLGVVVSFHGGLSTPTPAKPGEIRATVLVLHGADDPNVPPAEVAAFEQEMRTAKVDWQLNAYGGAVHAFTNPAAGDDPSRGAAYNAVAARRAWAAMQLVFTETVGLPKPGPELSTGAKVGEFTEKKIVKPTVEAGKKVGEAVKDAAEWTKEKIEGQ